MCPLFLTHTGPPLFSLCVPECGILYWSIGSLSGPTFLKKTGSPFPSRHQLPIVPRAVVRFPEPSPIHARIWAGLILSMSCAYMNSLCEFMCFMVPSCPANTVSLKATTPLVLTIFLLPLPNGSSLIARKCNIDIHFMVS